MLLTLVFTAVSVAGCAGCSSGDDPEGAVSGFLDALNSKDWDGMKSFMAEETLAELPDEAGQISLRSKLFGRLEGAGGRVEYTIERTNVSGEKAQVLVTGIVRVSTLEHRETVTFYLVNEDDKWKLLPKLGLSDNRTVENAVKMLEHFLMLPSGGSR